jgi:hypothetical protein
MPPWRRALGERETRSAVAQDDKKKASSAPTGSPGRDSLVELRSWFNVAAGVSQVLASGSALPCSLTTLSIQWRRRLCRIGLRCAKGSLGHYSSLSMPEFWSSHRGPVRARGRSLFGLRLGVRVTGSQSATTAAMDGRVLRFAPASANGTRHSIASVFSRGTNS